MTPKELALQLVSLDIDTREELLASLPREYRQVLTPLIDEVISVTSEQATIFEQVMAEFETAPSSSQIVHEEGSLRAKLKRESEVVKQRVVAAVIDHESSITPHVRTLLESYLADIPEQVTVNSSRRSMWRELLRG